MKTEQEPWKKTTWNYEKPWKPTWNDENQPGTMENHENQPGTIKKQPGTMKNHEYRPRTMKHNLEPRKIMKNLCSLVWYVFIDVNVVGQLTTNRPLWLTTLDNHPTTLDTWTTNRLPYRYAINLCSLDWYVYVDDNLVATNYQPTNLTDHLGQPLDHHQPAQRPPHHEVQEAHGAEGLGL